MKTIMQIQIASHEINPNLPVKDNLNLINEWLDNLSDDYDEMRIIDTAFIDMIMIPENEEYTMILVECKMYEETE